VVEVNNVHTSREVLSGYQTNGSYSSAEPFLQKKCRNKEPDIAPSLDTYLPTLSESTLGVHKTLLGYILQKDDRGTVSSPSRFKATSLATILKCRRQWETNKLVKRMVLGSDIGLKDTCRMVLYGLVGRFAYSNMCAEKLLVWLEQVWLPVLGYAPEVYLLTKGWIGFPCNGPEDVATLIDVKSVSGNNIFMLMQWRVAFNPETNYLSFQNIWVLLLGLLLYFWYEGVLAAIGDCLGKFLMIDRENILVDTRKVSRVLVEMDIHQGLLETLEIEWRGKHFL